MTSISSGMSPVMFDTPEAGGLHAKSSREQIEAVGEEFEGVFLSMMLKEMRNSLEDGFFAEEGSDSYGGMFDLFIGKHLAASSPLGINEMLLQQYTKNESESTNSESVPDQNGVAASESDK